MGKVLLVIGLMKNEIMIVSDRSIRGPAGAILIYRIEKNFVPNVTARTWTGT